MLLEAAHYRFQGGERHKLRQPWIGPFRIKAMVGPNAATLELPPKVRIHPTINVSRLEAYTGRVRPNGVPEQRARVPFVIIDADSSDDPDTAGQVERVIAFRDVYSSRRRNLILKREYLCQHKGDVVEDSSWRDAVELREPRVQLQILHGVARGTITPRSPVYRKG